MTNDKNSKPVYDLEERTFQFAKNVRLFVFWNLKFEYWSILIMKNIFLFFISGLLLFFSACIHKDFDVPPVQSLPVGEVFTISELRQMYDDSASSGSYYIDFDASVYASVITDEASGNFYREAYVQDIEDAVNVRLESPGGLRLGDSIRIYLKGVSLSDYNNLFQLDNVDNDSNIIILANQRYVQPKVITIDELNTGDFQSQLIQLNNVQFNESELGLTWADPEDYGNRTLEDCKNNTTLVRTSNYANFAILKIPEGKGSLIAIAGVYNETQQLYIRTVTEANMFDPRCDGGGGPDPIDPVNEVKEYFDDAQNNEDIDIQGWRNVRVVGSRSWQGKIYQSEKYAQSTAYNSGLDEMETWMITPPVINAAGDKILNFESAIAFWAHQDDNKPLTVFASTDYDGTNFTTAKWNELNVTLAGENSGDNNWVSSGDYPLTDFVGNVAVAFRYQGSGTESTSSRIDNVMITDEGGGGGEPIPPVAEVDEDFSSVEEYTNIDLDGWTNVLTAGNRLWQGKFYQSEKYAQATGYKSGLDEMVTWLITPPVINTAGDKKLSFLTAMSFWEHSSEPLSVMASTDYDGTNFETAGWTEVNATLANSGSGDNNWVESGIVDLSSFVGNVAVAFVYQGSDTESTSMRVDNVMIKSGGGGNDGVTSIDEDFESQTDYEPINLPGWLNVATEGSRDWQAKEFDSNIYAQATAYNSGENNVTWMITPKIDLDAMDNPVFEFKNAQAFWDHDGLTVLISTDFDGANVDNATWAELDCNLAGESTPEHEWVDSGKISLSLYSGQGYVAFKYEGTDGSEDTSYRIDDVLLYDE